MATLQTLPLELLLQIIEYLPPIASIDFALAHYSLLLSHRLVPALSLQTLRRLKLRRRTITAVPIIPGLPEEISVTTMRHMSLADRIRFAVAMPVR